MTDWRMSSSSLAISSRSSLVRWAIGLTCPMRGFFWIVVISAPLRGAAGVDKLDRRRADGCSVVEVARPGGRVDAGLDQDAAPVCLAGNGGGERAGAEVADDTFAHREHAAVADAHAAPARHEDTGVLGLLEDRPGAVALDVHSGLVERDGPALAGDEGRDPELLHVEGKAPLLVVGGQSVEQTARAAGERRTVIEVGHQS